MTDRAVRSLVKLFSADELTLSDDLAELQKFLDERQISIDAKQSAGIARQQLFETSSFVTFKDCFEAIDGSDVDEEKEIKPRAFISCLMKANSKDDVSKVEEVLLKFEKAFACPTVAFVENFAKEMKEEILYLETETPRPSCFDLCEDRLSQMLMSTDLDLS